LAEAGQSCPQGISSDVEGVPPDATGALGRVCSSGWAVVKFDVKLDHGQALDIEFPFHPMLIDA